jgi:hypothetical protein
MLRIVLYYCAYTLVRLLLEVWIFRGRRNARSAPEVLGTS